MMFTCPRPQPTEPRMLQLINYAMLVESGQNALAAEGRGGRALQDICALAEETHVASTWARATAREVWRSHLALAARCAPPSAVGLPGGHPRPEESRERSTIMPLSAAFPKPWAAQLLGV
eukprot:15461952-Alexandrium_andersonii.AAC.1